ncbi:MAG TPA: hypothetical protein VFN35_05155 [Ktedonobacteraceae bacterium]|nr:hypothetical protein [Ktedonobacteraceae bacterium]
MRRLISLWHVVRWLEKGTSKRNSIANYSGKRLAFGLAAGLVLGSLFFSACTGPGGGNSSATPTSSTQAANQTKWCDKPLMVFRDEGAFTPTAAPQVTATATPTGTPVATGTPGAGPGTPSTITDWSVVKANLGFTVYLPTKLAKGTCLVSAQATIHDPIFGGSFTIGYLLPDHTSLSISEAPLQSQNTTFLCSSTVTPTPITSGKTATPGTATVTASPTPANQLCSGAKEKTNIVISGPGTESQLQQIFTSLQSDVNWIPTP